MSEPDLPLGLTIVSLYPTTELSATVQSRLCVDAALADNPVAAVTWLCWRRADVYTASTVITS